VKLDVCVEMWHRPGGAELGNADGSVPSKLNKESRLRAKESLRSPSKAFWNFLRT
jgi:hypothetical protein